MREWNRRAEVSHRIAIIGKTLIRQRVQDHDPLRCDQFVSAVIRHIVHGPGLVHTHDQRGRPRGSPIEAFSWWKPSRAAERSLEGLGSWSLSPDSRRPNRQHHHSHSLRWSRSKRRRDKMYRAERAWYLCPVQCSLASTTVFSHCAGRALQKTSKSRKDREARSLTSRKNRMVLVRTACMQCWKEGKKS
ncbi:MAG: hypothetical protein ACI835_003346 [Planctomycetota bacterium]|jgi:hypothetical protein